MEDDDVNFTEAIRDSAMVPSTPGEVTNLLQFDFSALDKALSGFQAKIKSQNSEMKTISRNVYEMSGKYNETETIVKNIQDAANELKSETGK